MHRRANVLHIYRELQFNAVFVLLRQLKKREVTTNLQSILYNAAPYNLNISMKTQYPNIPTVREQMSFRAAKSVCVNLKDEQSLQLMIHS